MSRRYLVQIEAHPRNAFDSAFPARLAALAFTIIEVTATGETMILDGHLTLNEDDHQVDAHQAIKRALGAASLRTRWLELDEVAWTSEIHDPPGA